MKFLRDEGGRIILISVVALIITFVIYSRITDPNIKDLIVLPSSLRNLSIGTILLTISSAIFICYGIWKIYNNMISKSIIRSRKTKLVEFYLNRKKTLLITISSAVIYAIFFGYLSQMLIFVNESQLENNIPYFNIVPCCNIPGYVPLIYFYITSNFFITLIPINIVLLFVVSMLVGYNIALHYHLLKNIKIFKKSEILGSIGIACGLFIGCPTCAGSLIIAIFGFSFGTAAITLLASFQAIFIAISIPLLIITPYITIKNINKKLA
ncbi:MAG: hypothetical protein ACPKPY_04525 [Nitrososphaeraceae archaeon]